MKQSNVLLGKAAFSLFWMVVAII